VFKILCLLLKEHIRDSSLVTFIVIILSRLPAGVGPASDQLLLMDIVLFLGIPPVFLSGMLVV
jgi:hypothetical protein